MNTHPFERHLSVALEDIAGSLSAHEPPAWSDFLLNPRRLRGSDSLMRWSQGVMYAPSSCTLSVLKLPV